MGKKIVMVLMIVFVMLGGLGAGVYMVQQRQQIIGKAAPASTLSLTLVGLIPKVDENFVAASNINTGENQVIAVELHLTFDPARVEFVQANPGPFFSDPQTIGPNVDNTAGTVVYAIYISPQSTPMQGQGVVATFTFKAKSAGSTTIAYSPQTIVGAIQEDGQNVLVGTTPLSVNITANVTATPVPVVNEVEEEGIGGDEQLAQNQLTSTPSLTPTLVSTASATPIQADATLPDSGLSLPTILAAGAGLLIFVFAFALF